MLENRVRSTFPVSPAVFLLAGCINPLLASQARLLRMVRVFFPRLALRNECHVRLTRAPELKLNKTRLIVQAHVVVVELWSARLVWVVCLDTSRDWYMVSPQNLKKWTLLTSTSAIGNMSTVASLDVGKIF